MSDYREESEKAKQVKRGVVEQREKIPAANKRNKMKYEIYGAFTFMKQVSKPWRLGKYATLRQAEQAKKAYENRGYINVTIKEI